MSIHLPKIFLDSGDPMETRKAKGLLGHVDGQTTNPSLVAKNPEITKYLNSGKKLTEKELLTEYKTMVQAIGTEIAGPISAEVYADWDTKADTMLAQAHEMNTWGTNIYVKFPTIPEGVKAAHEFVKAGGHANMTLVFDQQQAGAIFSATRGTSAPAFISPFIGRWDDRGYDGMDLIRNIDKDPVRQVIVKNCMAMFRELNISPLAEGVETREEMLFLHDIGIDLMQGYYFAKPGFESLPEVDFNLL